MTTNQTNQSDAPRIKVRVVVAINSEEEAAVALVQDEDVDEALSDALVEISNGVPLVAYVIVLDLPMPNAREIRARVERGKDDVHVEIEKA